MKFCKDCKHWSEGPDKYLDACLANPVLDPVRGGEIYRIAYDSRGRDYECGPDAKWFEPKE
jgi:hypothetical protein